MVTTIDRRNFFTMSASATAGVAGAGVGAMMPLEAAQPFRRERVLDHVGKEFARLYGLARDGRAQGEHLHALANNLRLWATVDGENLDAMVLRGLRATNFGARRHQLHGRMTRELKQRFGMDVPEGIEVTPLQPDTIRQIETTLRQQGLTPTLLELANRFDVQGDRLARRGALPPLQMAQSTTCDALWVLELARDAVCAAAPFLGHQGSVACAVAVGAYHAAAILIRIAGVC